MSNPVLVEVTRGAHVESRHRGSVAVVDADGAAVFALGDVARRVFPRSAVKSMQALPLVEGGHADKWGLTDAEVALCCASHGGEPAHVATAQAMLAKAGRDAGALECGAHWPSNEAASRALAKAADGPSALHNNCSGKHSGFVCLACGMGTDPAGYVRAGHPAMREVTAALSAVTGERLDEAEAGVDGCSIPSFPIPLVSLARGFARMGTGAGLSPGRAAAAARIRAAVAANPFNVAGTGRFDTRVMKAFGARVFCKTGAEAVHCAAIPEQGIGIAVKIDDGTGRASQALMAALLARFLGPHPLLDELAHPVLRNWNGIEVGAIRPVAEVTRH